MTKVDSSTIAHIAQVLGRPMLSLGPANAECWKATMRAHLVANRLGEAAVGDKVLAPAGERWAEYFERLWGEPLGEAPAP